MTNQAEMKANTDVLAHIRKLNEKIVADCEREGYDFYTTWAEEIASEYETVYDFELSQAKQTYSDWYKEEVGFRPTLRPEWTLEEVNSKIELLAS